MPPLRCQLSNAPIGILGDLLQIGAYVRYHGLQITSDTGQLGRPQTLRDQRATIDHTAGRWT